MSTDTNDTKNIRLLTHEFVKNEYGKEGYELISDYINSSSKLVLKLFKSYLFGSSNFTILSICFNLDCAILAFVALYLNLSTIAVNLFISFV